MGFAPTWRRLLLAFAPCPPCVLRRPLTSCVRRSQSHSATPIPLSLPQLGAPSLSKREFRVDVAQQLAPQQPPSSSLAASDSPAQLNCELSSLDVQGLSFPIFFLLCATIMWPTSEGLYFTLITINSRRAMEGCAVSARISLLCPATRRVPQNAFGRSVRWEEDINMKPRGLALAHPHAAAAVCRPPPVRAQAPAASTSASVEEAVGLLHSAAKSPTVPPKELFAAMRQLERAAPPSRDELAAWPVVLGGSVSPGHRWRLVFTTGTKDVQSALKGVGAGGGSYFPLTAVQVPLVGPTLAPPAAWPPGGMLARRGLVATLGHSLRPIRRPAVF